MRNKLPLFLCILFITASSLSQDRIVFERRSNDNTWDIFVMNSDGRFPTNLTNGPEDIKNMDPSISPDGKMIAFSANRNPFAYEIFVMDLATRTVRPITTGFLTFDHFPEWSPDGQKIVFGRCNADFTVCDIFTVNADGSGPLTPLANSPQDDDSARFSPNGTKVAYASNRDGNYEIYVCDANGSNPQRVTTNAVTDGWPSWSPDGARIVFSSLRDGSTTELYTMDANGSNVTRLTQDSAQDTHASFSSDGRRLVWQRSFGSTYEIVEAPLETVSQPKRLTFNSVHDLNPDYGFVTRKVGRFY